MATTGPTNPQNAGGTNPWDDSLKSAYKQYTGRTPGAQELMSHYGNPNGLAGALSTIKSSPEAQAFAQGQSGTTAPTMPQGIDPRLAALYTKHNFTPTGQGTGFGDWQYWQDHLAQDPDYMLKRLDADLAGTGTDQPTGTTGGNGNWANSGAADRGGVQGGLPPGATMGPDGFIQFGTPSTPTTPTGPAAPPGVAPDQGGGSPVPTPQQLQDQLIAREQAKQTPQVQGIQAPFGPSDAQFNY